MEEMTLKEMGALLKKDMPLSTDFSNEDLQSLYSLAYGLYQSGNYEEARAIFHQLAYLKPLAQNYWMGLGGCYQMEQSYDEAVKAWGMASLLGEADGIPPLHVAECYFSLGKTEQAMQALGVAKSLSENAPQGIKDKIAGLEASWKKGV